MSIDLIRRLVGDDPEVRDLLDQALQGEQGARTDLVDIVNEVSRPAGNAQDQALRRLRAEEESGNVQAAELRAEVLAGRLSAHAAMVKAGFRRRTFSVPVDRPESVAQTLRKHMTPAQLRELRRLLDEETPDA